jgi:hypothetical protein
MNSYMEFLQMNKKFALSACVVSVVAAACGGAGPLSTSNLNKTEWATDCSPSQKDRTFVTFTETEVNLTEKTYAKAGCTGDEEQVTAWKYDYQIGDEIAKNSILKINGLAKEKTPVRALDLTLKGLSVTDTKLHGTGFGLVGQLNAKSGSTAKTVDVLSHSGIDNTKASLNAYGLAFQEGFSNTFGGGQTSFFGYVGGDDTTPQKATAGSKVYGAIAIVEKDNLPSAIYFTDSFTSVEKNRKETLSTGTALHKISSN